jgi:hypothetical protein
LYVVTPKGAGKGKWSTSVRERGVSYFEDVIYQTCGRGSDSQFSEVSSQIAWCVGSVSRVEVMVVDLSTTTTLLVVTIRVLAMVTYWYVY